MIVFFKRETAHETAIQYNQNSFMTYFRVATRQLRSADLQEALDTIKRKNEHLDIWNNVGALKFVSILHELKKKKHTKKLHDIYLSTTLHSLLFIPFGADFKPTTATRPTCGEHQDRVVPEPPLLQRQGDVAHRLVHGGHHAGVRPAGVVFDETVGGHVALRHLQRRVDGLQCHIEEERLQDTGRGDF